MPNNHKKEDFSCFVFGEGKRDRIFLVSLIELPKFKYHAKRWRFNYDNSSGGSADIVLEKCHRESVCYDYDLILCFIDLDRLKEENPKNWKDVMTDLENEYPHIKVIWQIDNAEDEYKKVLGDIKGKHKINKQAKKQIEKFINSEFWNRILDPIKEKEKDLDAKKEEVPS